MIREDSGTWVTGSRRTSAAVVVRSRKANRTKSSVVLSGSGIGTHVKARMSGRGEAVGGPIRPKEPLGNPNL
jgi:hypothetical protein